MQLLFGLNVLARNVPPLRRQNGDIWPRLDLLRVSSTNLNAGAIDCEKVWGLFEILIRKSAGVAG